MKRFAKPVAVLVLAAGSLVVAATSGGAVTIGEGEGCTPGYWKNHTQSWEEYDAATTVDTMLQKQGGNPDANPYDLPAELADLADDTMVEALSYGGGSDTIGAAQILLRAATASILNSAHEGLDYPLRRWGQNPDGVEGTIWRVRAVLDSLDRDAMLALAAELDAINNEECPLGGNNTNKKA